MDTYASPDNRAARIVAAELLSNVETARVTRALGRPADDTGVADALPTHHATGHPDGSATPTHAAADRDAQPRRRPNPCSYPAYYPAGNPESRASAALPTDAADRTAGARPPIPRRRPTHARRQSTDSVRIRQSDRSAIPEEFSSVSLLYRRVSVAISVRDLFLRQFVSYSNSFPDKYRD
ncbi:hypothetical protein [Mycolicibacterium palauense]|uniref:hypothetical protein n=1 Tax=Mycolicibacterium palauense TaxID=2034511 RepID=UPI0011459666|nr:hypothetical protein [Mycolicibacterium palauense]